MEPIQTLYGRFPLDYLARLEDLPIDCLYTLSQVLGEDLMGRFTDQLRIRGVVQLLKLRIHQEVASLHRFDMDDSGHIVDESLQQGFAPLEFLRHTLAF